MKIILRKTCVLCVSYFPHESVSEKKPSSYINADHLNGRILALLASDEIIHIILDFANRAVEDYVASGFDDSVSEIEVYIQQVGRELSEIGLLI